ncbi:MAG: hypothetical protein ACK559_20180, partial [bacterium]
MKGIVQDAHKTHYRQDSMFIKISALLGNCPGKDILALIHDIGTRHPDRQRQPDGSGKQANTHDFIGCVSKCLVSELGIRDLKSELASTSHCSIGPCDADTAATLLETCRNARRKPCSELLNQLAGIIKKTVTPPAT